MARVTMLSKNELEILNNGVEFTIKMPNKQVFWRLAVNKKGITWYKKTNGLGKVLHGMIFKICE